MGTGIIDLLRQAAAAFLFHFSITRSGFLQDLIGSYIAWGFTLLLEPLFLSKWGTTPGKWLLGISIRNQHGGLLTRKEAFARTVQVFFVGEGYGIPIYNIYRYIKCYNICTEKGVLPWDENLQYQVTPFRKRYILSYLVIATTLFFLTLGIGVHQMTPPHKGVLTVAEFTENYNHLVHYYTKDRLPLLHEDATWEDGTPIIEEADGKLLSFSIPSDIPGETKAWLSAALLAKETRIYPLDITGLTGTLVELDEEPS
ncbi:MAG: RDD family protein [Anaerotignum sp.]|nr:RDD family protein [Anaerotignum sp.]